MLYVTHACQLYCMLHFHINSMWYMHVSCVLHMPSTVTTVPPFTIHQLETDQRLTDENLDSETDYLDSWPSNGCNVRLCVE